MSAARDEPQARAFLIAPIRAYREALARALGHAGIEVVGTGANNSPLTLIVSQAGYQPQTRQSQLKPKQIVVQNFVLQRIC